MQSLIHLTPIENLRPGDFVQVRADDGYSTTTRRVNQVLRGEGEITLVLSGCATYRRPVGTMLTRIGRYPRGRDDKGEHYDDYVVEDKSRRKESTVDEDDDLTAEVRNAMVQRSPDGGERFDRWVAAERWKIEQALRHEDEERRRWEIRREWLHQQFLNETERGLIGAGARFIDRVVESEKAREGDAQYEILTWLAEEWASNPERFGDTDADARNEIRDIAEKVAAGEDYR